MSALRESPTKRWTHSPGPDIDTVRQRRIGQQVLNEERKLLDLVLLLGALARLQSVLEVDLGEALLLCALGPLDLRLCARGAGRAGEGGRVRDDGVVGAGAGEGQGPARGEVGGEGRGCVVLRGQNVRERETACSHSARSMIALG